MLNRDMITGLDLQVVSFAPWMTQKLHRNLCMQEML